MDIELRPVAVSPELLFMGSYTNVMNYDPLQEAHETGVALVVACPQDNAERYCEGLRLNGLTATIEPGGC
jgi:ATP-dependent Clp protease adaptor protein ClpS